MYRARDKVNAVETCTGDETMGQFLPHLLEQLEACQKSLSGYNNKSKNIVVQNSIFTQSLLEPFFSQLS